MAKQSSRPAPITIFSSHLYLITDRHLAGLSHIQIARRAIAAGLRVIQLREKHMSKNELYNEALAIRILTGKYKATFIINDYIDIALAVNADGVHLGQEDMPVEEARKIMGKKIIGVSTHSLRQAVRAEQAGADYIGFGPMFATSTKDAGRPKGLGRLKEVRRHIKIPIVAIGGITQENFLPVLETGADAVAVMSAVLKGDIEKNVKGFYRRQNENLIQLL
ncbi:MAG: thiamine phosphate synthase [Nitrospiraceae bacterium]|nr:MAG: thiamine phosphate synthase [Nitrospiraceae bacterium]